MTPEQINRLIAEKVMGWVETTPTDPRRLYWKGSQGPLETHPAAALIGRYFDPYHRIDHAMMALEKFVVWIVEKFASDNEYICKVWKNARLYHRPFEGLGDTPSAAICEAIVSAMEGKE